MAERAAGSLRRRLFIGAAAFIIIALALMGVALNHLLHDFVQRQLDRRIDAEIGALAGAVEVDGSRLRLTRPLAPPFDKARSGWRWRVAASGAVLQSPGFDAATIDPADMEGDRPERFHARDSEGRPLLGRARRVALADGATAIVRVAAPAREIDHPLSDMRRTIALALGALGLALLGAVAAQVRVGLAPLARLAAGLKAVRAGRAQRIDGAQPAELQPLVGELNALLEQNARNLERARAHVANLAHGLKTPLATLAADLADAHTPEAVERARLIALMDKRIAHHLRRARAAALGPARAATPLSPALRDLGAALGKIYADKAVAFETQTDEGLAVACDSQDLDEMLGNLLDNAFKWARTRVRVSARREGALAVIAIEDDGPGFGPDSERLLGRGARGDETIPGTGFGLPITAEIAELYGGALVLGASSMGGALTQVSLPLAAA